MKDEYLTSLALQVALFLQSFQQECINDEYVTSLTLQAALLVRPFQQECMKDEYLTLLCIIIFCRLPSPVPPPPPPPPHVPPPPFFSFFLFFFFFLCALRAHISCKRLINTLLHYIYVCTYKYGACLNKPKILQ